MVTLCFIYPFVFIQIYAYEVLISRLYSIWEIYFLYLFLFGSIELHVLLQGNKWAFLAELCNEKTWDGVESIA